MVSGMGQGVSSGLFLCKSQEVEAKAGQYGVTEAFLHLTAILLESGIISPTLQVINSFDNA